MTISAPSNVPEYVTEAQRIMARLRHAESTGEVELIANEERSYVQKLHGHDCETQKSLALGIINLKALRLSQLAREEGQ